MSINGDFYYNIRTGQVEEGRQSSGTDLMGPYATREEAARALDKAAARNETWDEEDRQWDGEDEGERS